MFNLNKNNMPYYEQQSDNTRVQPLTQQKILGVYNPTESEKEYAKQQGYSYTPQGWKFVGTITQGEGSSDEKTLDEKAKDYWHPIKGSKQRWKASWNNNTNPVKAVLDNGLGITIPGVNAVQAVYSANQTLEGIKRKNPMAFVDAGISIVSGLKSLGNFLKIARRAAYNNITPLGYDSQTNVGLGKKKELANMAKEILTGGDYNKLGVPKWQLNLGDTKHLRMADMNDKAIIRFRDQAWRKAMKQPILEGEPQIYVKNADGTYHYDMDAVNKIRTSSGSPEYMYQSPKLKGQFEGMAGDVITGNGGFVNYYKDAKGNHIIEDVWDLEPFKDEYRSLWKWGTKHIPGLKKVEAVGLLNGEKFKLKHDVFNN